MIDLPATMSASGARQLANESANRARWQHETITWQIGELDPRIMSGSIVRVPDMPGNWLLRSWEWMDRGITVELERLAPSAGAARPSDPGESLSPIDLVIPSTRLAVIELPPEDGVNPDAPLIFAAASAQSNVWRGAALFALQGTALVDLGTTGTQRATMGTLHDSLPASQCLLFEPYATATIDLVAPDLELIDTDIEGIAAGANRLLIGGELVQFLRALPQGERRQRDPQVLPTQAPRESPFPNQHEPGRNRQPTADPQRLHPRIPVAPAHDLRGQHKREALPMRAELLHEFRRRAEIVEQGLTESPLVPKQRVRLVARHRRPPVQGQQHDQQSGRDHRTAGRARLGRPANP